MLNRLFHFKSAKPSPAPPDKAEPEKITPPAPPPPPPPPPPPSPSTADKTYRGTSPMARMATGMGIAAPRPATDPGNSAPAGMAKPPAASAAPRPPVPGAPAGGPGRSSDVSLYKNLLAGLYDGVLIFDMKGSLIGNNPRAEHYFGFSAQELWGMRCGDLVTGIDERMLFKLRSATATGRFTVVNGKCKRSDGTTFPAEIAISRTHILNEDDLIFSVHHMERHDKLRDQREAMEQAVLGAGAGIAVCDKAGMILYANPAFIKVLNLNDSPETVKRPIADFCCSMEAVDGLLQAPAAPGVWVGRLRLKTPKGGNSEVLATSSLSDTASGGAPRLTVTLTPMPMGVL